MPTDISSIQMRKAFKDGNAEACAELLSAGLFVNDTYEHCSLLYWSALCGHVEVCRVLIEHGADANRREVDEKTPLHAAVQGECGEGNAEICAMLLNAGADPRAEDDELETPVDLARVTKQNGLFHLLINMEGVALEARHKLRRERDIAVHRVYRQCKSHVRYDASRALTLMMAASSIEKCLDSSGMLGRNLLQSLPFMTMTNYPQGA